MNRARPHGISAFERRQTQVGSHVLVNTGPNEWIADTISDAFSAIRETIRTFQHVFRGQLSTVALAPYEKGIGYCTPPLPSVGPALSPALPRPTRLVLLSAWFACPTRRRLTCLAPLVPLSHQKVSKWVSVHAGACGGTLYQIVVCRSPPGLRAQRGGCGGHDRTGGTQLLGHISLLFLIRRFRQFARLFHNFIQKLLLQHFPLVPAPLLISARHSSNRSLPKLRQGMFSELPLKRRHCLRITNLSLINAIRDDRTLPLPLTEFVQSDSHYILDGAIMAQLSVCLEVCPASQKARVEWPLFRRRKLFRYPGHQPS